MEINRRKNDGNNDGNNDQHAEDLAAAMRDSSARRDSSLSSAYSESAFNQSAYRESRISSLSNSRKTFTPSGSASFKTENEPKIGFWSSLAKKAKSALLDEDDNPEAQPHRASHVQQARANIEALSSERRSVKQIHSDPPIMQKGLDAITTSLTFIGGTIGNAIEGGINKVETKASDIISDTKRTIKKKTNSKQDSFQEKQWKKDPNTESKLEMQLKASRDVAMAMTAKYKALAREMKTMKADLAFSQERCEQLKEENRGLRECNNSGERPDDDLIRCQLETLLAEKSRLAQACEEYARENRHLREIVDYHKLTMQDVVQLDENMHDIVYIDENMQDYIYMDEGFPDMPDIDMGLYVGAQRENYPSQKPDETLPH